MSEAPTLYTVCGTFAPLLRYPTAALPEQARRCRITLDTVYPKAAARIQTFCTFLDTHRLSQWEEIYTLTFDLQAVCCPYVGYHLFGESYKRGGFMARLRAMYREWGHDAAGELPDHIAVIMDYLGHHGYRDTEVGQDLLNLCVKPALAQMLRSLEKAQTPYRDVLEAMAIVLDVTPAARPIHTPAMAGYPSSGGAVPIRLRDR